VHEVRIKIKISSDIKLPGVQRVFWFALMGRILGIVQVPLLSSMLGCPSQALGLRRYIRTKVLQIKNSIGCCRGYYAALPKTLSYRGGGGGEPMLWALLRGMFRLSNDCSKLKYAVPDSSSVFVA